LAIAAGLVFVAVIALAAVKLPNFGGSSNAGFGPDWDCERFPEGGSVCLKRPPAAVRHDDAPSR
jgi:hypothetical protein